MYNMIPTMKLVEQIVENFRDQDLKTIVTALSVVLGMCLHEIDTEDERKEALDYVLGMIAETENRAVDAKGPWAKFFSALMTA